jgi:uncharacterized protein YndB with AHSA1/START domain
MAESVQVQREIAAPPERVWEMVADVTRMGEWSPETTGCRWVGGATGPEVGARFRGSNRKGWRRWSTTCTVVESVPGAVFAFDVKAGPVPVARWEYRFEPAGPDATVVTESWHDQRGPAMAFVGGLLAGVKDREAHNRVGMAETLDRLAAAAERDPVG